MNWSNQGLKLTMGCGALAQTAVLTDLLEPSIGVWGLVALIVMPLAIVAMIKVEDQFPIALITFAHGLSVTLYLALAIAAVIYMAVRGFAPTDVLMVMMLALGLFPCVAIVRAINRGDYRRSFQDYQ